MCRQYVLSRARSGTTSGTTVTSITSIFGTGNTIGVHEDCANDVCICRWCADDMWMTCVSADDMQMTPGIVLQEIGQLREVWHVDDMRMTCVCRWCADDMQTTCVSVDDVRMTCADDTRCSTPWNWATQASVRMTCGRRADDICHLPVKSHPKSHSRVIIICTSSARLRPHETSTPNIFPLKEQRQLC